MNSTMNIKIMMKKRYFLLLIVVVFVGCNESSKYPVLSEAVFYIAQNDSVISEIKRISGDSSSSEMKYFPIQVSPEKIDLPSTYFNEELKTDKLRKIVRDIEANDESQINKVKYDSTLLKYSTNKESNFKFFVADLSENYLTGELLYSTNDGTSYRSLTRYTSGIVFLFKFNEEGKIDTVVHHKIYYD